MIRGALRPRSSTTQLTSTTIVASSCWRLWMTDMKWSIVQFQPSWPPRWDLKIWIAQETCIPSHGADPFYLVIYARSSVRIEKELGMSSTMSATFDNTSTASASDSKTTSIMAFPSFPLSFLDNQKETHSVYWRLDHPPYVVDPLLISRKYLLNHYSYDTDSTGCLYNNNWSPYIYSDEKPIAIQVSVFPLSLVVMCSSAPTSVRSLWPPPLPMAAPPSILTISTVSVPAIITVNLSFMSSSPFSRLFSFSFR